MRLLTMLAFVALSSTCFARAIDVSILAEGAPGDVTVETKMITSGGVTRLEGSVHNHADAPRSLLRITIKLPWFTSSDPELRIAAGGTTMVWPTQVFAPPLGKGRSGTYLQARHDNHYSLAAFVTWNVFWSELTWENGQLVITIDGEGRLLRPGENVPLETVEFSEGPDWQQQLFEYADRIARNLGKTLKPRRTFVGWSTWDYYGRTWTAQNVTENLAALQPLDPRANILQIDGGWWPSRGDFTRWRENLDAAGGMKGLAGKIRAEGLIAGIHFDGGRGDSTSAVYQEHPDYFLHDDTGELLGQNQRQANELLRNIYFDYSHPGVRDYLKHTTRTLRHDWGYDYIKIDFLWYNLDWAIRRAAKMKDERVIAAHDRGTTSVERLHLGMAAFRDGMGPDAWFLGCGAPFGISYRYVDSLRTGFDVWPNLKQFKSNVTATGGMFYLNGRVVYNDADYQIGRSKEDQDRTLVPDPTKDAKDLGINEVELWATYVGLFSIAKINSDSLPLLRPERRAVFERCAKLPTCRQFVPLDFWDHATTVDDPYEVMLGDSEGGVYLAVFNWTKGARSYRLGGMNQAATVETISGEAQVESRPGELQLELKPLHSVVFRLTAHADFDHLRRALTLKVSGATSDEHVQPEKR